MKQKDNVTQTTESNVMAKTIRLKTSVGKFYRWVFIACGLKMQNLTMLYIGALLAEQLISAGIEYLIWGETFKHWIDSVFIIGLSALFIHLVHALGDFLLDLHLNGEPE